ncbi:hypothetical protein [uncultured Rikenella sp.]|uniref:hypothetical protein n=1 Tax=uncultured Rikenella sp. TaxID=368003 RepID=UPI0026281FF1|nr:hypothetical protein [uncultured Rikenella sp.]
MRLGLLMFFCLWCFSCGTNSQEKQIQNLIGKTLLLPSHTRCVQAGVEWQDNALDKEYKIVTYLDPSSCSECALQILRAWKKLLDDFSSEEAQRVGFLCLANAARMSVSDSILARLQIPISVYYDLTDHFIQDNELYIDAKYRTFLIDHDNRILLVGEPLGRPKLWELYKSTIARLAANGGTLPETKKETDVE